MFGKNVLRGAMVLSASSFMHVYAADAIPLQGNVATVPLTIESIAERQRKAIEAQEKAKLLGRPGAAGGAGAGSGPVIPVVGPIDSQAPRVVKKEKQEVRYVFDSVIGIKGKEVATFCLPSDCQSVRVGGSFGKWVLRSIEGKTAYVSEIPVESTRRKGRNKPALEAPTRPVRIGQSLVL